MVFLEPLPISVHTTSEALEVQDGEMFDNIAAYCGEVVMALCMNDTTKPCAAPNACALAKFCQYP